MNGTGVLYKGQETAERVADDLRREAYDLLTSLELLNREIDSARIDRFIQARTARLDQIR